MESLRIGKDERVRLSVDTVAGTRGFAVAPIERFAVSSNDLMQLSRIGGLHEKIRLFEKGITATVGDRTNRQNQFTAHSRFLLSGNSPEDGRGPAALCLAIVAVSGGQYVVQARYFALVVDFICSLAMPRELWKSRTWWPSPATFFGVV